MWRDTGDGHGVTLVITATGLAAIGLEAHTARQAETEATAAAPSKERKIREGTKQALLIEMLRRPEGATLDELVAVTKWQSHTIRGAMAGALKKKLGLTIVYVTHDQAEAMALSDRMLVMDMGVVQQVDTPTNMYNNPANRFVFSFLGLSNFMPVALHDGLVWPAGSASSNLECEIPEEWDDDRAVLATRPNEIQLTLEGGYRTRIKNRVFLGDYVEYRMDIGDAEIRVQTHEHRDFRVGDVCGVRLGKVKWYSAAEEISEEERERRKVI